MKNTKTKSAPVATKTTKSVAAGPTSRDFGVRLSKAGGRIVGVTTVSGNKTRKLNGQVRNVSANYVTIYDRNAQKEVKFSRSSILSVTGV